MQEYFDHEEVRRFFKFATVAVVLLCLFLAAKSLSALKDWREPSVPQSTIVVSGTGEAFATPDIATFSFSVSADAKAVADAQSAVNGKIDAVLAGLKDLGIDDKDIQTTNYSVYPKYSYAPTACTQSYPSYCPPSRQVPDGYTASETVTVKVRKTENAGQALAAAGEKGATDISGLNFTVDDMDAVNNEARDKAVAEAKTKAEALADSLGVHLGRVVDFADSMSNPGPYPYMYAAEAGGTVAKDVSISTGQNKITDTVTITYEIR